MEKTADLRYGPDEIAVDRFIQVLGLLAGGLGSAVLIGIAARRLGHGGWWPIMVYSACLLAMLGCSAAYALNRSRSRREILRRLDHAAIFLMIAGTYTPFTTRISPLTGAYVMTASVWLLALAGAFVKLRCPYRIERADIALYLGLGWIVLAAWRPLMGIADSTTVVLIVLGGALYTIGVGFHVWRTLRFQNSIWHGFVLVAAGCHYAAILRGVLGSNPLGVR